MKNGKNVLSDFAKVNVYVIEKKIMKTVETPVMSATQLVSEIGGQLGIWIGFSVVTMSEVLELAFVSIIQCLRQKVRKLRKVKNTSSTELDNLSVDRGRASKKAASV